MANVTVYDLENYPDNGKTVAVNLASVVPTGGEGDEKWVLSASTTGYSNNTSRTAIQDLYIQDIKAGWEKSSGHKGSTFTIAIGKRTLGVKMDACPSTYYIELDVGVNLSGDVIAEDMEAKIRAVPDTGAWLTAHNGYKLAYKNASVEFTNNRFIVISGEMSPYYTGAYRSSVLITVSGEDTAFTDLGFDMGIRSEVMAGLKPREVLLASTYTLDTTPMAVGAGSGAAAGRAMYITDGTNADYFTALAGTTDTSIVVPVSGTNGYTGVAHTYTVGEAKVQLLEYGDPEIVPLPCYTDIDALVRFGIRSMANQLDFSS